MSENELPPEEKNNVIPLFGLPVWERLPDRTVETTTGYTMKLCRLDFCDKPMYAKGLCDPHYKYMRQGRLDTATGGLLYSQNSKQLLNELNTTSLPHLGDMKDWVYILQTREFVQEKTLIRISLQAAADGSGQVVRALVRNNKFRTFLNQKFVVYNPHDLEQRLDEEGNPAKPPQEKGVYNTFMPERMMWAKNFSTTLSEPLETLIKTLAGEEREYFEKWLAFTLRKPGTLGTALILRGIHGSGKSVLAALLKTVFGPYASTIRIADIENPFNSWLEDKLVIFGEEMASGGFREQIKTMNELKKYIAGGQTTINRKGVPQYSAEVCARWMLFSNAEKPIIMEPTERRYSVIESLALLPQAVGRELDENRTKYAQELLDYLHTVDISDFWAWTQLENGTLAKIKEGSKKYFD